MLNPDKTEELVVGPVSTYMLDGGCDLVLDGVELPWKDQVHSFGILLDEQVVAVATSVFYQFGLVR